MGIKRNLLFALFIANKFQKIKMFYNQTKINYICL